jgi:hypothetical protein
MATDADTRKEDMVFSMQSSPRLYNEDQQQGSKYDCAGEGQQQLYTTNPFSH